jgi:TM2 domain-containing membrane protein YozV
MKKYILSPLCSALIIPGLGQIINQHIKKGLCILSFVFVLFILGAIKLFFLVNSLFGGADKEALNSGLIIEKLQRESLFLLWVLLILFAIVWIYSVVDAFWTGKKIESQEEGNRL